MKRALRRQSSVILRSKLPQDTMPLFDRLIFEPCKVDAADIVSFRKQFGLDDVWIFHGIAVEREGRAVIVSGPPGIGKSTLLRKCSRMNIARPVDDGFVLVGSRSGCYFVIESGLYSSLGNISIASKWLRVLTAYQSPYLSRGTHHGLERLRKRDELLHNMAFLIGSFINRDRSSEKAVPILLRLEKLFLVRHQEDIHPPKGMRKGRANIESLDAADAERIFSPVVSCEVLHPAGRRLDKILWDRILASIVSIETTASRH